MGWNICPAKAAVRQCLRLFIAERYTVPASEIKTAPHQSRQPESDVTGFLPVGYLKPEARIDSGRDTSFPVPDTGLFPASVA